MLVKVLTRRRCVERQKFLPHLLVFEVHAAVEEPFVVDSVSVWTVNLVRQECLRSQQIVQLHFVLFCFFFLYLDHEIEIHFAVECLRLCCDLLSWRSGGKRINYNVSQLEHRNLILA